MTSMNIALSRDPPSAPLLNIDPAYLATLPPSHKVAYLRTTLDTLLRGKKDDSVNSLWKLVKSSCSAAEQTEISSSFNHDLVTLSLLAGHAIRPDERKLCTEIHSAWAVWPWDLDILLPPSLGRKLIQALRDLSQLHCPLEKAIEFLAAFRHRRISRTNHETLPGLTKKEELQLWDVNQARKAWADHMARSQNTVSVEIVANPAQLPPEVLPQSVQIPTVDGSPVTVEIEADGPSQPTSEEVDRIPVQPATPLTPISLFHPPSSSTSPLPLQREPSAPRCLDKPRKRPRLDVGDQDLSPHSSISDRGYSAHHTDRENSVFSPHHVTKAGKDGNVGCTSSSLHDDSAISESHSLEDATLVNHDEFDSELHKSHSGPSSTMPPGPGLDASRAPTAPPRKTVPTNDVCNAFESLGNGQSLRSEAIDLVLSQMPEPDHMQLLRSLSCDLDVENYPGHLGHLRDDVTIFVVPICVSNHWVLGILDISSGAIDIYDSCPEVTHTHEFMRTGVHLGSFVQQGYPHLSSVSWSVHLTTCYLLEHPNFQDSGLFTIVHGFHYLHGAAMPTNINVVLWRAILCSLTRKRASGISAAEAFSLDLNEFVSACTRTYVEGNLTRTIAVAHIQRHIQKWNEEVRLTHETFEFCQEVLKHAGSSLHNQEVKSKDMEADIKHLTTSHIDQLSTATQASFKTLISQVQARQAECMRHKYKLQATKVAWTAAVEISKACWQASVLSWKEIRRQAQIEVNEAKQDAGKLELFATDLRQQAATVEKFISDGGAYLDEPGS